MNTTAYLIRHGDVEYEIDSRARRLVYGSTATLSQKGRNQIAKLSEKLLKDGVKLDGIFTSPLKRAVQSAKILSEQYGIAFVEVESFRDVEGYPAGKGMTMDELKALKGDTYFLPGHESAEHSLGRIKIAFEQLCRENEGKTIAFVGHGDPIRVLIFRLKNPDKELPPMRELAQSDYLDNAQAWRLVLDKNLRLVESEVIGAEGNSKSLERKF